MRSCSEHLGLWLLSVSAIMLPSSRAFVSVAARAGAIRNGSRRLANAASVRNHACLGRRCSDTANHMAAFASIPCGAILPTPTQHRPLSSLQATADSDENEGSGFFADPGEHPDFESIGVQSPILIERVEKMLATQFGMSPSDVRPSAVQAAAYPTIASGRDLTIGAETGSGKTLATYYR